jgi:uncharacterized protein YcnI
MTERKRVVRRGIARRVLGLTLVLGSLLLFAATSASAHVTVSSPGAVQGGYSTITITVPTESATASTTALRVTIPADHPIASVAVQPHPGWSFSVRTTKLATPITSDDGEITEAVSEISWRADSAASAIKPGEFDTFSISAGPLPAVDALTLPTIQTYSDGSVVKWIEKAAPGSSAEPDHPAPSLVLAASASSPTSGSDSSDGKASTGVAVTGIVLGAVGLLLGALALLVALRRRPVTAATDGARPTPAGR